MAVTATPYRTFEKRLLDQSVVIDFDTATIKVALTTSSYTPDRDAHDYFDDVTNELSSGGGYTAGGLTLTGVVVGTDDTGHFAYVDADDAVWSAATFTARRAVIYKDTGTPSTSPLIGWIDFGADQSPSSQDFTIAWAATSSGGMMLKVG